ncbi:MAG: hypothetical protein O3A20_03435 [Planctomycetota bacterium]|nr:hypothetical protein [Planctomycetota bacterium]
MPRIFRKLRADLFTERSGKYLRYAIGELLLVVIGILIALQINNLNQKRIEQNRLSGFAHSLIQDLEQDLVMLVPIVREMTRIHDKVQGLAIYMQDRPIEEVRNLDLLYLMSDPLYRPYSWNRVTIEQMKSAGVLRQLRNRELADKIAAYEAFSRHLDEDFAYDRSVGGRAFELANHVVDMNYPHINEVISLEDLSAVSTPYSFPDSPWHRALGHIELPLLTRNVEEVRVVVNSYLQLDGNFGLIPRRLIEMPKLDRDIKELIALLQAEYPQ